MPQVIPAVMMAAGTFTAVEIAATTIAIAVGQQVYGSAQRRKLQRKAKKQFNAGLQDRTVTGVSTDAPHRYVYGRTRVGSDIVAMFKSGNKDQYQHVVYVHADHECDGIEEVYVAGKKISDNRDADGWVLDGEFTSTKTQYNSVQVPTTQTTVTLPHTPLAGTVGVTMQYSDGSDPWPFSISGSVVTISPPPEGYTGVGYRFVVGYNYTETTSRVRVTHHLGYPDEPADTYLMSVVPDKWTAQHRLSGKCYSVVTVDLNEPDFQAGPPTCEVVMRGAKLYDFRVGVTAWSQNAVLAIYHYLTSEMCGIPASDLPMAQWIAAANVAGQVISGGQRYTINGTVTADQAQADVLEQMADAMAGTIVSTTWDISAGAYLAPVMALQKEDIVGGWSVTPGASEGELFNGVRGKFFSAEAGYVTTDCQPYQNSTFVNADGRALWADRQFAFTDETWRVHSLCRIEMEQIRNGMTFKALFSLKAWSLKVDNRITLTHDVFGWASKVFIVLDKRYVPVTGAIELTLKEDDPSIWDSVDAFVVDATPNTNLGNPFSIAPPASLSWTSGTDDLQIGADGTVISRIRARWPAVALASGVIEIEWQQVGSGVWQKAQVSVDDTETYLSPVQDGAFYSVRARCFDPGLNRRSDWVYAPTAVVIGKSAPPADVPFLLLDNGAFSFGQVTDRDLAGYRFRFQYGNNPYWDNAAPLADGLVMASPWQPTALPPGTITVMVKAEDRSGNLSENAAVLIANLGDPIVDNVVLEYSESENGWPSDLERTLAAGRYDLSLPDLRSFSRPIAASFLESTGRWQWAPADTPRFDFGSGELRLLVEPERTNHIRNSTAVGAIAPFPKPAGWGWSINGGTSVTYVGIGVEDGIDYVDLRIQYDGSGPTGGGRATVYIGAITDIAAVAGDVCEFSVFLSVVSGSMAGGNVSMGLVTYDSTAANSIPPPAVESVTPGSGSIAASRFVLEETVQNSSTTGALAAFVRPEFRFVLPSVADFTLRIGLPQLERLTAAEALAWPVTSPIRTSTGPVTRAADVCVVHGIEGGEIVDGALVGQDGGDMFWGADSEPFWGADTLDFWPEATYRGVVYINGYSVTDVEARSRLTLIPEIVAQAYSIEYRYNTQGEFWGNDNDLFWKEDAADFWPGPTSWSTWLGELSDVQVGRIEFRITMAGGPQRPVLSDLVLQFDVPDESENLDDVVISAAGTRLPITKAYRLIKNVKLTLQDNGGTVASVFIKDKSTAGPLIFCRNSAGNNVAGLIDATVQGIKG